VLKFDGDMFNGARDKENWCISRFSHVCMEAI
jgi:hypothetical protein